jgi:formate hydrogenlyase transcriptional activator
MANVPCYDSTSDRRFAARQLFEVATMKTPPDLLNTASAVNTVESGLNSLDTLQEALRDREEFVARMIESSQDCFTIIDLEGRLMSVNSGGLQALGIDDFAPYRRALWCELWPREFQEAARKAVETAHAGGLGRFIGCYPTVDGTPKWWDVAVKAILDKEGRPKALLAISRDITDSRKTENLLRAITEGTASVTGRAFYDSLVKHLASSLEISHAFITECQQDNRVRVRAFWHDGHCGETFEYELEKPCMDVVQGHERLYTENVRQLFPSNKVLAGLGVESYLGVPAVSSSGRIMGHLVVLDIKPIEKDPLWISVLRTFATRAAVELEREQAEEKLRAALDEVEALKNRLEAENVYLQEEIRTEHRFDEIVGKSPALIAALHKVELAGPTDSTVLIVGETGCGKELFARAVHSRSRRSGRPLVKVNCGAIAPGLVESELFGHVKGAFTGAVEKRVGRFELANGGTIFLDEISELPLEAQVKLLRVLQEQEFEPVGSSRTIKVNVRVIAATNRDLDQAFRDGKFRDDLLYRLNVFPIHVPPLRERRSDISLLVAFFTANLARKLGKPIKGFNARGMDRLLQYSWPGNIRELQNVVERAAILSAGPMLDLEGSLLGQSAAPGGHSPESPTSSGGLGAKERLQEVERSHIISVLRTTGGVVGGGKGAAAILGLHPNTLRSRMKKLGISSRLR